MKGNLKKKAILVMTAFLVILAFTGATSAQPNAWVNDTPPSDVAPGDA